MRERNAVSLVDQKVAHSAASTPAAHHAAGITHGTHHAGHAAHEAATTAAAHHAAKQILDREVLFIGIV